MENWRNLMLCLFIFGYAATGCSQDSVSTDPVDNSDILGRWQLEYVTNEDKTISKPDPYDGTHQIQILFQISDTLIGTSARNCLEGVYKIQEKNKINIRINFHTEIAETQWGNLFLGSLPMVNSYDLSGDTLILYYDNRKLFFVRIT